MQLIGPEQEIKLIEAVTVAGRRLLEFWPGGGRRQFKKHTKSDGSFVTDADYASNEILVEAIRKIFPADGILSEELPRAPGLEGFERLWIIDPLDGTHPFIEGLESFAILVALAISGRPSFGIINSPARHVLARAQRGQGALYGSEPLKVSAVRELRPGSVYFNNRETRVEPYACDPRVDGGLAVLMFCRGELDGLIFKIGKMGEWDMAAPVVIIEESGGVVSDEKGQRPLFNTGPLSFKYLVASNGYLHEQLLALPPRGSIS